MLLDKEERSSNKADEIDMDLSTFCWFPPPSLFFPPQLCLLFKADISSNTTKLYVDFPWKGEGDKRGLVLKCLYMVQKYCLQYFVYVLSIVCTRK